MTFLRQKTNIEHEDEARTAPNARKKKTLSFSSPECFSSDSFWNVILNLQRFFFFFSLKKKKNFVYFFKASLEKVRFKLSQRVGFLKALA